MKWDDMKSHFGRDDLMPFWVADMDFKSPPEVIEALRRAVDFGVYGYAMMADHHREAVALWEETRHGWQVDPKGVAFSPGIVTGLCCAVEAFTKRGEGIVIQTPVYPPFFEVVNGMGRKLYENPLIEGDSRYEIDFDDLAELLALPDVKAMILCSPHNPVARVWTREELMRLGELCLVNGVTLLADEIHQDLVYSDAKHIPIAKAVPELRKQLVTLVAPSKTFNMPGLASSAWIAEDDAVIGAMSKAADAYHLGRLNMMGALAMETAYRSGGPWLDALLSYLEGNRALVEDFVRERLPDAMLKHPEGTYIFWLDFRGYGLSSDGLQRILTDKARVALNAGTNFGRQGEGFARLNVGCPRAYLQEGLERIASALA